MSAEIFHRVLVADDGSPDGERAAEIAISLAARFHSEVILLGVVEPPNIQAEGEGLPLEDPSVARRRMEDRFERFLRLGRARGIPMMVEIVEGRPSDQIRKRAQIDCVDLVVVGRRKISGIRRWFEGSTSESLLRDCNCSVLVAR